MAFLRRELEEPPLLQPYQAFATGAGKDDDGPYMALVLVHDDAKSAKTNVGLLQQRIGEGTSLRTSEPWREFVDEAAIRAEGRVLLAKLRGERIAANWLTWYFMRDPLIPHK